MLRNGYNLTIFSLLTASLFLFFWNFTSFAESSALYFLNVPQGESEFLSASGVQILFDAGYGNQILTSLDKIFSGKYLDLGIISTLEPNYFNGYNFLLQNYSLGAVLWNGRLDQNSNSPEWAALISKIKESKIPMIKVAAGDRIKFKGTTIKFISPPQDFSKSSEPADASLAAQIESSGIKAILAGGIGENVEAALLKFGFFTADVFKVPQKYTSPAFINTLKPKISVIPTGPKNLPNLADVVNLKTTNSLVLQTGLSGTIKIEPKNGKLKIFTEK
jgi:beta-lactamase superfamily II metal-dependent hydrolase